MAISLGQQAELIRKERDYEREQLRHDTEVMGIGRRVKRGECWYPISVGRSYYNALDRLAIEVTRTEDTEIEHCFEYGRTVCFFDVDGTGKLHYQPFTATVSFANDTSMTLILPDEGTLERVRGLERGGVQLSFDETTYRLMLEALAAVTGAKGNRLAELRELRNSGAMHPSFTRHNIEDLRFPWLNPSQEEAVNAIVDCRDFLVVHGPPGTGKTTTLVEGICEVLRREPQVLVCAQSNTAVDWICGQLAERGVPVVRIGNPARVTDNMLSHTYERRFEGHPEYPQLWQIRRTLRQLRSTPRKSRSESFHQKLARLRERADELEIRIRQSVFDSARVIAATLAGSANPLLTGMHFHTLFIDEAAQALEAACWIAIRKADRFILAGDHCQLPPTVKSPEALKGGLGTTLMETLAATHPSAVRLLTVQYRMNEALMRFSSDWFYGGRLEAAPEVRHRSLLDDIDEPLLWVDTSLVPAIDAPDYYEEFVGATYGRINKSEAELTLRTLEGYVRRIGRERLLAERVDFGIISPYKAQVQYLRRLLGRSEMLRPLRRAITINTVDAFQGQERDVVLVSLVRANERGEIGFLRDLRRMNVAITRARLKLIILGNSSTLCRHAFYRRFHAACHPA